MSRDTQINAINNVSSCFCLAKWLQVTIDLVHGTNHSCHHPVRHKIPLEEIEKDPSALHNTLYKMKRRKEMLQGQRPKECEYCWKIEDSKGIHYSDRLVKSLDDWAYPHLDKVLKTPAQKPINPTYVEVMFDKSCNFSCGYCMSDISSKIESEIVKFGPYPMENNSHRLPRDIPVGGKTVKNNPYIAAFWRWFPDLIKDLKVFRITGGEPLLSRHTFRVIEEMEKYPNPDLMFAINSNLGVQKEKIEAKKIGTFELYTSLDTHGEHAEFIRAGLKYDTFIENLKFVCEKPSVRQVVIMVTYSILSIPRFHLLLEQIYYLKQRYPKLILDVSYLKEPEYLRANLANAHLQNKIRDDLELMENLKESVGWPGYSPYEINKLRRIYHWVTATENPETLALHKSDFYLFVNEYSQRKKFQFEKTFPELKTFYAEARKLHIFSKMT